MQKNEHVDVLWPNRCKTMTFNPWGCEYDDNHPVLVKQTRIEPSGCKTSIYCTRKDALNIVCVRLSVRLMCIPAENVLPTDVQKPTIISIYYIYISISPRILVMFCEYTFQCYINKDILSFNISLWKNWDIF